MSNSLSLKIYLKYDAQAIYETSHWRMRGQNLRKGYYNFILYTLIYTNCHR